MNMLLFEEHLNKGNYNGLLNLILNDFKYLKVEELENISDFVYPFVDFSTSKLIKDKIEELENETILEKIQQNLSDELVEIVSRTLVLEIAIKKIEYPTDEKDGEKRLLMYLNELTKSKESYLEFFCIYHGLLELILKRIYFFSINFKNTIDRLNTDILLLKEVFSLKNTQVMDIKLGLGDSHNEGKKVSEIVLDNKSIIYKPRNNEITESINEFFFWLHKNSKFTYRDYTILNRGSYSWEEKISYETCHNVAELEEYFMNFGYIIGFIYLMNGIDFHYENVIVNGSSIVLIDAETLLHPQLEGFKEYDILSSGLLPNENNSLNLSSLTGDAFISDYQVEVLSNIKNDSICFAKKNITIPEQKNLVTLNNKEIVKSESNINTIREGFKEFCNLIIKNKSSFMEEGSEIATFNNKKVRVLLRPTMQYHEIMTKSTHPDHIKSKDSQKKFIYENLKIISPNLYLNEEILNYETEVLSNFDIPYFYINTEEKNLYSGYSKKVNINLNISPFTQLVEKIKSLNIEIILNESSKIKV